MWFRSELKANAKQALKRFYWMAFAVCLIYSVVAGIGSGGTYVLNFMQGLENGGMVLPNSFKLATIVVSLVLSVFSLALSFFALNPLGVGMNRYFMESRNFKSDFSTMFYGFTGGRYWKTVKVTALMTVKILLWSCMLSVPVMILYGVWAFMNPAQIGAGGAAVVTLLALVLMFPGIIKTYEYSMILYLVAENPNLETKRYFALSKAMTDGEKMSIFVLGLSFIGWELLGLLACGVGTWFVVPYVRATHAELYALLRAKAFSLGFSDSAELPDFLPPAPPVYGAPR